MKTLSDLVFEDEAPACRGLETYSATVLYTSSFGAGGNDSPFLYGYDCP